MGSFQGTPGGELIVQIDAVDDHYEGRAFIHMTQSQTPLPSAVAYFVTPDNANSFDIVAQCVPINPKTASPCDWSEISQLYPNTAFSPQVSVKGKLTKKGLNLSWASTLGTKGRALLPRSEAAKPSTYSPTVLSWDEYKRQVNALKYPNAFIFRGQRRQWRLRTNYHRTGRADLQRFSNQDILALYKHLSTRTRHVYDLSIPDQNGAFYNLVQHHGYPTPLLDWSASPYVAAFFSFRRITNAEAAKSKESDCVRIFKFNAGQWRQDWRQLQNLDSPSPHFSLLEFMGIDNERMLPQQALSTVSNIDDIESYIQSKEQVSNRTYLEVIDIHVSEKPKVARELELMGITAGSLFPGLDGACEQLKERFFPS